MEGKQKYHRIYKDSCYQTTSCTGIRKTNFHLSVNNCPIPQLAPHNKLMPFIKSIPLGHIYSVYDTLCEGLCEDDKVYNVAVIVD